MLKKPNFIVIALAGLIIFSISLYSFANADNEEKKLREISIGFYNVENLFDTFDDPEKDDDEFLPSSDREWTPERYTDKVVKLSTVISKLGNSLPTIVGLCEVENKDVVVDLTKSNALKKGNYGIVHYDSPDMRGIDVGLIYRKDNFKVIYSKPIAVNLPEPERPTRDILYVKGKVKRGPELHIFVNHWPSRWGGADESEFKRIIAAGTLKTNIDSIIGTDPDAMIISMGDFNDYPYNKSISKILNADSLNSSSTLVNLMAGLEKEHRGSYNYRGDWGFLDQIIVTRTLTDNEIPDIVSSSTKPYFFEEMVYIDENYGDVKPNRSYGGTTYYAGYSDHLPVYTILKY